MKKYKCEIWRHHVKIDEYENENPVLVKDWFNKNYKEADEWGECCHYFYVDGIDVAELREQQHKDMIAAKSSEEKYSYQDKLSLLNFFIRNCAVTTEIEALSSPRYRITLDAYLNDINFGELGVQKTLRYILKKQTENMKK